MKDSAMIETKRMILYPASREQMEEIIAAEADAELKKAYGEMLAGALNNPGQWEWYTMWILEKDGTRLGDLCFKGLDADGAIEIGYGIMEEYQGQGYATEALQALLAWAFSKPEVTRVEAETEAENIASQRVLEKCGFLPNGKTGQEGPRCTLSREEWEHG